MRLIAAPGLAHGSYRAGVEIDMSAGSHTYWKNPGEAGVPPVFSFNGSQNVARADVTFPTPARITEQGLAAFGYTDHVLFPVTVTPRDPGQPSELHADVTYAVCNKICIPAHGTAVLRLPPDMPEDAAKRVTAAFDAVPAPLSGSDRGELKIERDPSAAKPTWRLQWTGTPPIDDLFVDAPGGFYFATTKDGPQNWTLTADQSVAVAKASQVPVSLVLARRNAGSLATTETLDLPPAKK